MIVNIALGDTLFRSHCQKRNDTDTEITRNHVVWFTLTLAHTPENCTLCKKTAISVDETLTTTPYEYE